MGLDNIPNVYPCDKAGTAVKVTESFSDASSIDRIDCEKTQAAHGCPVMNDLTRPTNGAVLGMLGTSCWYRGKVGQYMLSQLEDAGYVLPDETFYGDGASGADVADPDYCRRLASWMADHAEAYASIGPAEDRQERIERYHYAIWWLHFIAYHGDGFNSWW